MNQARCFVASLVTVGVMTVTCNPVSETTATYVPPIAGIVVGGIALGITWDAEPKPWLGGVCGLVSGGLTYWILHSILSSMTPRARYAAASQVVSKIELDSLVTTDFDKLQDFELHVNGRFGTSWPLVLAREHIMSTLGSLAATQESISEIIVEIGSDTEYTVLYGKCRELKDKIANIVKKLIVERDKPNKCKDYNEQCRLYERHMEAERERTQRERLQQQALSHDSWQREMDRWHESSEKQKDRDHKTNILNQHPVHQVVVNI